MPPLLFMSADDDLEPRLRFDDDWVCEFEAIADESSVDEPDDDDELVDISDELDSSDIFDGLVGVSMLIMPLVTCCCSMTLAAFEAADDEPAPFEVAWPTRPRLLAVAPPLGEETSETRLACAPNCC